MENPLFTKRVSAGSRVYYFDVFTDKQGEPYMAISEIPTDVSPGEKKRQRLFIHADAIERIATAFKKASTFMRSLSEPDD